MSEVLRMSAPWYVYARKIEALFSEDPNISVEYDEDENVVNLRVNGQDKADALTQILPAEKDFGNITVKINVIPANKPPKKIDLFNKAFEGNPIFSYALSIDTGMTSNTFNYVVFKHLISQIWEDNLGDVNGNVSELYEDIAREIFEDCDGILFNTDLPGNPGRPLLDKYVY